MDEATKKRIWMALRERDCPFFEDEDFEFYFNESGHDVNNTIYRMLIVKSEDTTLSISGMNAGDTSKYFLRLAQQYRPNNSGILVGGI